MLRSVTNRPATFYRALYETRKQAADPDISRMLTAQQYLNDEIQLPLAEINQNERPAVANLARQGNDQLAKRVASIEPAIYFPSLKPGDPTADEDSITRGRVVRGWREDNNLRLVNAQRARRLLAYASGPVVLKPDPFRRIPTWQARHPLQTFPSDIGFSEMLPDDCIFTNEQSYGWLLERYPEAARALRKRVTSLGDPWDGNAPDMSKKFTLIEYIDCNEITMCALGDRDDNDTYGYAGAQDQFGDCVVLTSVTNYAGMCTAVVPGSVSLDKQQGHFDSIFGMYHAQAILMALSLIAAKRAVFPVPWAISNPGETVKVRTPPDPYAGIPGEIDGGTLQFQNIDPSMRSLELADRLEYNSRQTAGLPSEFGGASPTNVRTGRRGAQVMASTIDFTISETQDILAASTRAENKVAIAIDKGFFPGKRTYFVITRSFKGNIEYNPRSLWRKGAEQHQVDYPMGGTDLQNLPIEGGQRVQMHTMSRRRFMEIDPAIPDPDAEEHQIVSEAIMDSFISSIAAQAADPAAQAFQPMDIAKLRRLVKGGMELEDAVEQIHKEAQERQAKEAPPGDPAAMPGLAQPGMGAEQPTAAPPGGVEELTQLLGSLGSQQMAGSARATTGSI